MTDGIGRCKVGDNRGSRAERRTSHDRGTAAEANAAEPNDAEPNDAEPNDAEPNDAEPNDLERRTGPAEGPVLPDRSRDDLDVGWGDDPALGRDPGARDDDWYQRERPPHYE